MNFKMFTNLTVSGLLLVVTTNVYAIPSATLMGTLDMSGSFYALDASGVRTGNASNAVAIDFDFFGMDKFRVISADGNFAGSETVSGNVSTLGSIKDFNFDTLSAPIEDFWVVQGFSFDLINVARTNTSSAFIDLIGTGIISSAGFADTAASWTLSADTSGGGIFSWSASSETESTSVPEPGILALLSLGLIGLGVRKKFK